MSVNINKRQNDNKDIKVLDSTKDIIDEPSLNIGSIVKELEAEEGVEEEESPCLRVPECESPMRSPYKQVVK